MTKGITGRRIVWKSPKGKEVEIVIKRMTSFTRLSIFTIDYQVTLKNCDAKISFVSTHEGDVLNYFDPDDPRVAGESFQHITVKKVEIARWLLISSPRRQPNLTYSSAAGSRTSSSEGQPAALATGHTEATATFSVDAVEGETIRLIKYTSIADSISPSPFTKKRARRN